MTVSVARSRVGIAALALSAAGFVSVVLNEDYTSTAVIPIPGDVPTIGFGTTAGVHLGDRTTPPKALVRALSDMAKYEGAIKKCIHVPLFQWEFDAYVDFSYNVGAHAFCASTLVKKLNTGDYAGACNELLNWTKANGRVVPGLIKRRERERQVCIGATQ
jgi:lysozyme